MMKAEDNTETFDIGDDLNTHKCRFAAVARSFTGAMKKHASVSSKVPGRCQFAPVISMFGHA